jgi:surface carbohydrate biosynthesis protein
MSAYPSEKHVVLLVDSKQRDLLADVLIARYLEERGVVCHLEPLEAYRGVLAAWRPSMIIFNHLTAGHLAAYSRRLAEMGVLTAVLTNEGICYDREILKFIVGNFHQDAHIDYFLFWNGELQRAMDDLGVFPSTRRAIVGIPRFDFYCEPWSRLFRELRPASPPRLLACTNFWYGDYRETPEAAEVSFGMLKDRVPAFKDYRPLIEIHHRSRQEALGRFAELARGGRWELVVRPHPCEQVGPYRAWLESLPAESRSRVMLDTHSNITALILNSDLVIGCETCTTTLEAWLAKKPSLGLTFERHPVFFHEELAQHQPLCDRAADLPAMVEEALSHPEQSAYAEGRQAHIRKWCHTTDGTSCLLVAETIRAAVANHPTPDWSRLTLADQRRAAKLRLTRAIGEAYHYDPLLPVKYRLAPKRYAVKHLVYQKSIRPSDVLAARRRIAAGLASPEATD